MRFSEEFKQETIKGQTNLFNDLFYIKFKYNKKTVFVVYNCKMNFESNKFIFKYNVDEKNIPDNIHFNRIIVFSQKSKKKLMIYNNDNLENLKYVSHLEINFELN